MNLAFQTQSAVKRQYPDEIVLFSTIATILETRHESPIGWSPRRLFQRRGDVVITNSRIFIQSGFLSLITVIWICVIGCGLYLYIQNANVFGIVMAVLAAIFIIQRRPYSCDLPFNSIRRVHFGAVRGLVGRFNLMSIVIGGRAIQLVTAHHVPDHIRERLTTLDDSREHY